MKALITNSTSSSSSSSALTAMGLSADVVSSSSSFNNNSNKADAINIGELDELVSELPFVIQLLYMYCALLVEFVRMKLSFFPFLMMMMMINRLQKN